MMTSMDRILKDLAYLKTRKDWQGVKQYRDLKNILDTAREEGRAEAKDRARAEGRLEASLKAATKMKSLGFAIDQIAQITKLSEKVVKDL